MGKFRIYLYGNDISIEVIYGKYHECYQMYEKGHLCRGMILGEKFRL